MALGSSQIDESRYPRSGQIHESPDYPTAANRIDIDVHAEVGSLRIRGAA